MINDILLRLWKALPVVCTHTLSGNFIILILIPTHVILLFLGALISFIFSRKYEKRLAKLLGYRLTVVLVLGLSVRSNV